MFCELGDSDRRLNPIAGIYGGWVPHGAGADTIRIGPDHKHTGITYMLMARSLEGLGGASLSEAYGRISSGVGLEIDAATSTHEAESMLHAAIGLQPGNWSTYANLAIFYYRQGRYADAAEQFAEVVSINPTYVRAYSNLGASYMMAGDFAAALATYRKSLEVKADRLTYANLGMMNYYLGRYDDAEAALREAIAMAPEQHLSWSNLGDVLFVAGRQAEAREAYATAKALVEKQLAVNPGDPGMQMDHAWIHAMLGEREEALLEITRALAAAPDDPYASYYEGLVYHRFGETELALAALERAVERALETGNAGHLDVAGLQVDDDEDGVAHSADQRHHFYFEEVHGRDGTPVRSQERGPG